MELINDIFLAPYYLFNYIFSLAVWCILVIYSLNWYQEYNEVIGFSMSLTDLWTESMISL